MAGMKSEFRRVPERQAENGERLGDGKPRAAIKHVLVAAHGADSRDFCGKSRDFWGYSHGR